MWVVEFESHVGIGHWIEWWMYATYEEAVSRMVMEIFIDPDYQMRIREVSDVGG